MCSALTTVAFIIALGSAEGGGHIPDSHWMLVQVSRCRTVLLRFDIAERRLSVITLNTKPFLPGATRWPWTRAAAPRATQAIAEARHHELMKIIL